MIDKQIQSAGMKAMADMAHTRDPRYADFLALLSAEYDDIKECLVVDDTPELRGKAQQLRALLAMQRIAQNKC